MKKLIITGGNSGLGHAFIKHLDPQKYEIIAGVRNPHDLSAWEGLFAQGYKIKLLQLDLTKQDSISNFASKIQSVDLLVNNAGVFMCDFQLDDNNVEHHFNVNYLSHYILTKLLLPKFKKDAVVINVSSLAHKMKDAKINFSNVNLYGVYTKWSAYQQSKLANAMFGIYLAKLFEQKKMPFKSIIVHPGVCATNLGRSLPKTVQNLAFVGRLFGFAKVSEAAKIYVVAAQDHNYKNGDYIGPTGYKQRRGKPGIVEFSNFATNVTKINELILLSQQLVLDQSLPHPQFVFDQLSE